MKVFHRQDCATIILYGDRIHNPTPKVRHRVHDLPRWLNPNPFQSQQLGIIVVLFRIHTLLHKECLALRYVKKLLSHATFYPFDSATPY